MAPERTRQNCVVMNSCAALSQKLQAAWRAQSHALTCVHIEAVDCTGSTNQDVWVAAREHAPEQPRVLAAWEQSAGRGRHGRRWQATPGHAVLLSVAVPWPEVKVESAVTLACGVAVAETLRAHGVAVGLKWPNDVLFQDRKLAGLLTEMALDSMQHRTLVVGLGLNLWPPQHGLADAASLSESLDLGADAAAAWCGWSARLAASLLDAIGVVQKEGFAPFAPRFDALFLWRDQPVRVLDPYQPDAPPSMSGIARGIDAHGRLLIDADNARVAVSSGEISLRRAAIEGQR